MSTRNIDKKIIQNLQKYLSLKKKVNVLENKNKGKGEIIQNVSDSQLDMKR